MAVVTDIIKAWNNLDSDNRSVYRKVEDFAGAMASTLGLPVKNVMRDARGIYNTVNSFINGEQTTGEGIKNSLYEAVTGNQKSDGQQLYEAMVAGDSEQVDRVKGRFKDNTAISTAIRKALRENDPRIKEAAEASVAGDTAEYYRIFDEILDEGNFELSDIKAAISAEIDDLEPKDESSNEGEEKAESKFTMEHFYNSVISRDSTTANAVREDIVDTHVENGKSREEAESSFETTFRRYVGDRYVDGEIDRNDTSKMLTEFGGRDSNEAYWDLKEWDYEKEHGSIDDYSKYNSFYDAVKTGRNIKSVISEYTSHGVTTTTLATQIAKYYKPLYLEMTNNERASIKGYLLNAYVLLGYDWNKKSKDIDKWLEE
jgi:hypothetical protein